MNRSEISAGHSPSAPASAVMSSPAAATPCARSHHRCLSLVASQLEAATRRTKALVELLYMAFDQINPSDADAVNRALFHHEALTVALRHELSEFDALTGELYSANRLGAAHA